MLLALKGQWLLTHSKVELVNTATSALLRSSSADALVLHESAHCKAMRHCECISQLNACLVQCKATQLLLGGNAGQCSFMQFWRARKRPASLVLANGAVQLLMHRSSWRHDVWKAHLPTSVKQWRKTQKGLGVMLSSANGQLLFKHITAELAASVCWLKLALLWINPPTSSDFASS